MKTFDQFEEELASDLGYDSAEEYLEEIKGAFYFGQRVHNFYKEVSRRYAREYVKEALDNAYLSITAPDVASKAWGNIKRSIISESNLPKHD